MLKLYDSRFSGNSWKIRILLNQLQKPFERHTLDLESGETKTNEFYMLNRFSRIPVLQLEDGRTIVESAAILLYLAEGSPLLPEDAYMRSQVISWLFFEQGDLQRSIPLARVYHIRGIADKMSQQIERLHADGYLGLEKLDRWLTTNDWLVGGGYTLADLALFPYVSLAHEGKFDMQRFQHINSWLDRVRSQPGLLGIFDLSSYQSV
ncbi:glutathione S-transferase family protein [Sinorhizobium medicae]|uniref:Glutathione S-transferase n=1 Tax=Sinorhizobium medicae TaxID=110321 RepID=A0A508WUK7_9HYPH|nr:glutathione S-transferase family protein [Sinorhizobium medicae]MBO1960587.1 glutathione S-transferase family protein [Sinorhizobium medicae]WQO54190.1 glutathione S-transferase family protein [Sinorhizobium medicae]WQP39972.1 glutathione S-transferase family protein [Sinorhizobium medicae]VTZ59339.1 Glutathione S-transferase [Sinorhizobium medicae]